MFTLSDKAQTQIKELRTHFPAERKKSALLPALHIAQEENQGWLSVDAMDAVAHALELLPIEVYEVASFYSMYHLKPVGKYVLEVCRTGPCCLVGAERIISHISKSLGIQPGETTADGLFTLKPVECLASCGTGPVLQIGPDYKYYENLTEASVDALIADLRQKSKIGSNS